MNVEILSLLRPNANTLAGRPTRIIARVQHGRFGVPDQVIIWSMHPSGDVWKETFEGVESSYTPRNVKTLKHVDCPY